jgi:hypothetical protein
MGPPEPVRTFCTRKIYGIATAWSRTQDRSPVLPTFTRVW